MKFISFIIAFILFWVSPLFSQHTHFTKAGVIEFEKTINMHALITKAIANDFQNSYKRQYEDYMRSKPQFKKVRSSLTFSGNQTFFKPDVDKGDLMDHPLSRQPNTIITDLATGTKLNQKIVYDDAFLIKDSVRKITWKITDEFREIAGYPCRRANAVISDSIYVVAFYTDEIAVSGGPESFTGLPGMILGVALPHDNVTWFATRVMEVPVAAASLTPPLKGKPITMTELREKIRSVFSFWNYFSGEALKAYML